MRRGTTHDFEIILTGTINNSYTARVYGVKLYDLIGG